MKVKNAHTILVQETILECGLMFNLCRVWRNETGMGYTKSSVKIFMAQLASGIPLWKAQKILRPVHYGFKGSADIIGYLWDARMIGLEIKIGKDTQSEDQELWQKQLEAKGGFYKVIRAKGEAKLFLEGIYNG